MPACSSALTWATRTRLNCMSTPELAVAWFAVEKPATMLDNNCVSSPAAKVSVEYKIKTSIYIGESTAVAKVVSKCAWMPQTGTK